jgi:hypothetical protein
MTGKWQYCKILQTGIFSLQSYKTQSMNKISAYWTLNDSMSIAVYAQRFGFVIKVIELEENGAFCT